MRWYFIAAGLAKNCVLQETKAYPRHLRSAFEYITVSIRAAAANQITIPCEGRPDVSPSNIRVGRRIAYSHQHDTIPRPKAPAQYKEIKTFAKIIAKTTTRIREVETD
jgi:hypothetical protein